MHYIKLILNKIFNSSLIITYINYFSDIHFVLILIPRILLSSSTVKYFVLLTI
jgi:hypothetical protein